MAENAVDNGVEVRIRREVTGIEPMSGGGFTVTAKHWEPSATAQRVFGMTDGKNPNHEFSPSPGTMLGGPSSTETISCGYIINAAGCHSDRISAMVGDTSWHVKPRLGEYILLHKTQGDRSRHILFPCPHPVYGKGVLVQKTLWGNLILGPTARDTMKMNPQTQRYEPDPEVQSESYDNIMASAPH